MNEFDIIREYFARPFKHHTDAGVLLGIGDDCALLDPPTGEVLAVSVDTLVEGVHFFPDVDPARLGHKALAVNLSDLAAMGAQPRWFTLALTLPSFDPAWLTAFSAGMARLAHSSAITLVGGDTTRGPLSITVQVIGTVPPCVALRRGGASPGDDLWVSGVIGAAVCGLELRRQGLCHTAWQHRMMDALEMPNPRWALGMALRGVATAAIDVSDGLLQDLGHLLSASSVGAHIDPNAIPTPFSAGEPPELPENFGRQCLVGGDDYELCFAAPASQRSAIERIGRVVGVPVTRIGWVCSGSGMVDMQSGRAISPDGYRHF